MTLKLCNTLEHKHISLATCIPSCIINIMAAGSPKKAKKEVDEWLELLDMEPPKIDPKNAETEEFVTGTGRRTDPRIPDPANPEPSPKKHKSTLPSELFNSWNELELYLESLIE